MPRLAIIADDLTGALDSAVAFAGERGGVVAATGPDFLSRALAREPDVLAVSTRSREVDAATAQARVSTVLAALPPGVTVFKKIDSRLKGNVAAELAPFAGRPLLVAPAIPEFGRNVRAGRLEGFGVPEPLAVRPLLGPLAAGEAIVPDCATDADLDRALAAAPPGAVLVGARGLAMALARASGAPPVPLLDGLPAPVCFIVGSTDPITAAQVAALQAARPDLRMVEAPSGAVPVPPAGPAPALCLIRAVAGPALPASNVAAALADGAVPWLRQARSAVLSGGATAEAVLDALGVGVLRIDGEALPGLPRCRAGGRVLVTKSGGFGAADALVRLAGHPAVAAEG